MNGHSHTNGSSKNGDLFFGRVHPQVSFAETGELLLNTWCRLPKLTDVSVVEPSSFFGQLRSLYSNTVLKAQLERMKESGAYYGFDLKWQHAYDVRPMHGAKTRVRDCVHRPVACSAQENKKGERGTGGVERGNRESRTLVARRLTTCSRMECLPTFSRSAIFRHGEISSLPECNGADSLQG